MHLACDGTTTTFSVDGKVLYENQTIPSGTVTFYTVRGHVFGIEELVITGVPDRSKPVTGPTGTRIW